MSEMVPLITLEEPSLYCDDRDLHCSVAPRLGWDKFNAALLTLAEILPNGERTGTAIETDGHDSSGIRPSVTRKSECTASGALGKLRDLLASGREQ
jgi:hypothetical protein